MGGIGSAGAGGDFLGAVGEALDRINGAWLAGWPRDIRAELHDDVVMAYRGFAGRVRGAEELVAGFEEFCSSARVVAYEESERDVTGGAAAAVATFRFRMIYEREGKTYESTGRDLWVFVPLEGRPVAVWRTMLELEEREVS